jgi:protein phosphatase 1 regulatory subunit 7
MSADAPAGAHAHAADGACCDAPAPARRARLDAASLDAAAAAAAAAASAAAAAAASGDPAPAHRVVLVRDVMPVQADAEELTWVGTAGAKVTLLGGLEGLPRLRALRLRSNLLASTAGLRAVAATIEELEVYDNLLTELEDAGGAARLADVDASYNALRSLDGLARCGALRSVLAAANKLRGGFPADALRASARSLVRLDLGANGLTDVRGLGALAALEELWLGKNKLAALDAAELAPLRALRILDVQSNRLTELGAGALPPLPALAELYVAHNALRALDARVFAALPALHTVDVSGNPLEDLAALAGARALADVWAGGTRVATFDAALGGLRALPALRTLYLEHAPVAKDWEYRLRVARELPALTQLDADAIRR